MEFNQRYSLLTEKSPAEIVLLQGTGCFWKKCTFCDYYLDAASEKEAAFLNEKVLNRITGETKSLVVLNSGSYFELPKETRNRILEICKEKGIKDFTIESHWLKRKKVVDLKNQIKDIFGKALKLHGRIGIETFDEEFREAVLKKGMGYNLDPFEISKVFDECCLLFGIEGQKQESFMKDLEIAKKNFKHIYVNIFTENTKGLVASQEHIEWFKKIPFPKLQNEPQITVLINNTDLGVGD